MNTKPLIFAMLLFTVAGGSAMAGPDSLKVIDTVSGRGQKAIQAAMPEFVRRKLEITGYRIVVMESDASLVVLIEDPTAPSGQRGGTPNKPGFEVELSKDKLQVIRANFVR